MIAKIEIDCRNPKIVLDSLKPDMDESTKFKPKLNVDKDKIILTIEAKEISGLLAGINSYMRLIKASTDTMGI